MRPIRRHSALLVSVLALSLAASSATAQGRLQKPPQRGGTPDQNTPQILVTTFASSAASRLGFNVANQVRSRIQSEHAATELFATPQANIEQALRLSGYAVDSTLNETDLFELARMTHSGLVLDGRVASNGTGLRAESRILTRAASNILAQPLPVVDAQNAEDVAKIVERNITAALKQLAPYNACITDLRAQQYQQAVKDGALAIAAYPNSTLGRICQLQAFNSLGATDSVIAVSNALLERDSANTPALTHLIDAWQKRGNAAKVADYATVLARLDPTSDVPSLIDLLIKLGAPERALSMVDMSLARSPADTGLLRKRWMVLRTVGRFKEAVAAGEDLRKANPAAATADFYSLQIGAAQKDSNAATLFDLAVRAATAFPDDASFATLEAQQYRKAGQLQPALTAGLRAVRLEPKSTSAVYLAALTAKDLSMVDTAAAIAIRGIAAGADRATLEPFVLGPVSALANRAQASNERGDWEAALAAAQKLDASLPSPMAKFLVGLSSFSIGSSALQNAKKLGDDRSPKTGKDSRAKACAEAKVVEEMWAIAQTSIIPGGVANKEGAAQVMRFIQQYGDVVPQMKQAYCTGR